jgi:hypothetical protein
LSAKGFAAIADAGRMQAVLPFLFIDFTFLAANLFKVAEGGWMLHASGAIVTAIMHTWRCGTQLLLESCQRGMPERAVGLCDRTRFTDGPGKPRRGFFNQPPERVGGTKGGCDRPDKAKKLQPAYGWQPRRQIDELASDQRMHQVQRIRDGAEK